MAAQQLQVVGRAGVIEPAAGSAVLAVVSLSMVLLPPIGLVGRRLLHLRMEQIADYLVADVHTDGPSEPDGDPGAVLHEAVGRIHLLLIAVDNGPDRMVFAGPVLSHYEFTKPYGTRLTDELWRQKIGRAHV